MIQDKSLTICVNCKHRLVGSREIEILSEDQSRKAFLEAKFYDRLCSASRTPGVTNFVTGEVTKGVYLGCSLVNSDGNCELYEQIPGETGDV